MGALLNLSPLARIGAALGLCLALVLGGYVWGHSEATHFAQLQKAKDQAAAAEQLRAALADAAKRGQHDVAQLQQQLAASNTFDNTQALRTDHARHLLTVSRTCPPVAGLADRSAPGVRPGVRPGAAVGSGDGGVAAGPGLRGSLVPAAPAGAVDHGAGVGISLAGVSLWNSALTGADVPAGACRADDPASPACAADSGLEIADVWANHNANAALCRATGLRFKALIDHLQRRDAAHAN